MTTSSSDIGRGDHISGFGSCSTPEHPLDDEAINEVACHLRSLLPALSDQKRAEYRYSQSLQDQLAEMERADCLPPRGGWDRGRAPVPA